MSDEQVCFGNRNFSYNDLTRSLAGVSLKLRQAYILRFETPFIIYYYFRAAVDIYVQEESHLV